MSESENTYYDSLIRRIKNNKYLATVLLLFIVFSAISGLLTDWFSGCASQKTEESVIQTRYFTIEGHGISLALEGCLDDSLKQLLQGESIFYQNELSFYIKDLQKKYAKKLGPGTYFHNEDDLNIDKLPSDIPLLPGTFFYSNEGKMLKYLTEKDELFWNINNGWNVALKESYYRAFGNEELNFYTLLAEGRISQRNIAFWKYIGVEEATSILGGKVKDFYLECTKHGYPAEFFKVELLFEECGGTWMVDLIVPLLSLRVMTIENLSDGPIEINDLIGKIRKEQGIKGSASELKVTKKYKDRINLKLEAGQTLVVPVALFFSRKNERSLTQELIPFEVDNEKVKQALEPFDSIRIGDDETYVFELKMDKEVFINSLKKDKENPGNEYLWHVQEVNKVKVDKKNYEPRENFMASLFISHGISWGSCPFIETGERKILGTVLTGLDDKSKEGVYRFKNLPKYKEFALVEYEREVSYIKWIRMVEISPEKEVLYHYPKENILKNNEEYLVLEQGERFSFGFDVMVKNKNDYYIECYGYYVPLNRNYSLTRREETNISLSHQ